MKEFIKQLSNEFLDKEYAHGYMEAHLVSRIAAQVHALRKERKWSQEELAERSGIAQEKISKIESADFESLTMKTFKALARAFDVNLKIVFEPFRSGIFDVVNLNAEKLKVPPREKDLTELCNQSVEKDKHGEWSEIRNVVSTVSTEAIPAVRNSRLYDSIIMTGPNIPEPSARVSRLIDPGRNIGRSIGFNKMAKCG